ncbi:hypothetical protein HYC85_005738 [Camellia sinensis]|uniref:AP2/ERF domain-containing protein n=1 Tax=Camellia sinensis TaxID=4442 RepID=A0A7J7I0B8_CAMSI|nr:hypothetical protein HYC85_005738 [Camellia sinensis]
MFFKIQILKTKITKGELCESNRREVQSFAVSAGINGQGDSKLTCGINFLGMLHRRRKGNKVDRAYDEEESAARAYDLAALEYCWTSTFTNFPKEIEIMQTVTKEEYLASLRRKSSGVSKYRGVARFLPLLDNPKYVYLQAMPYRGPTHPV